MANALKPLRDQVVVITGASSGIGLATARLAAGRGAKVVLSSRDEQDLARAAEDIRTLGGDAIHVVADVADRAGLERVALAANERWGRIDTWINNAGVSMYGRIEEVTLDDARRLFETNYWGVVHGSLVALPYLKRQGGALINVGSVLSDVGYPLQGHYAASKHAVKGFTDSLRIELAEEGAPVSVTLIQPAAIDTPYTEHARNYLAVEPKHQPPVYAPSVVAETILACAVRPRRNVLVGGGAKMFTALETLAPTVADRFKKTASIPGQKSDRPPRGTETLHAPKPGDGRVEGSYEGKVMRSSAYTTARLNPGRTLLGLAVVGAGVALASRWGRRVDAEDVVWIPARVRGTRYVESR